MEKVRPILDEERKKFYKLWHSYHAKYKIPYSHDEKEKIFNSIAEIFIEEKPPALTEQELEKILPAEERKMGGDYR